MLVDFTDSNFDEEVINKAGAVLVDFWAPWCPPCRQLTPLIEQLAKENQGTIKIGKLNIDESPIVTRNYRVDSIPTLLFFKDGQVVNKFQGVQPRSRLQAAIEAAAL
jgi:thioredoxin 1